MQSDVARGRPAPAHLTQRASFAVIAKADIEKLRAWGRRRGWNSLRLLSSHDSRFNEDFNVELDGAQLPAVSVFARDSAGSVRHFYTTEGSLEFRHHRAMDLFTPVWNLLDLLPDGRGARRLKCPALRRHSLLSGEPKSPR